MRKLVPARRLGAALGGAADTTKLEVKLPTAAVESRSSSTGHIETVAPAAATSQSPASSEAADSDDAMARGLAGAALALAAVALAGRSATDAR